MRQTIVGAFNEYAAAQRAAEYLASQGIERNHIHVQARQEADDDARSTASSAETNEDRGVIANVRSFFTEVFGPDSGHEGVSRHGDHLGSGNARVVVDIDEDWQVTEVCRTLRSAGAIELDQQAREWRTTGWSGFDEGLSPAYAADRVPAEPHRAGPAGEDAPSPTATPLPDSGGGVARGDMLLPSYQAHWRQNYGAQGGRYEDYDPAYRYGHALASDSRYRGQAWEAIEPSVRADWEGRYPGSAWLHFQHSVRHAWERASDQGNLEASYREHFDRHYSPTGAVYSAYEPAYRYGQQIAGESRYQGQDWATVEAPARQEWEARHGASGNTWERIKGAVKHAWERARP